ncbi:MAG: T9SS type A sorting domain-containing protein [Candidatus Electryonea clarkiae]|nr:T9SS type A sorting domain-containing protein [Candidatus Electryonea clarkiae]MDP8285810.1 T9SS type A sorting domain-containing protein [Candidatus Electryonea clarkiae]
MRYLFILAIVTFSTTGAVLFTPAVSISTEVEESWIVEYDHVDSTAESLDIVVDQDGNSYVLAVSEGSQYYILLKYSPIGELVWETGGRGKLKKLSIFNDSYLYAISEYSASILKFSTSGELLWEIPPIEYPYLINDYIIDNNGNICLVGWRDNNITERDYFTSKISDSGELLWTVFYDGPGHEEDNARSIAVDNSGGIYVTGTSFGYRVSQNDILTIKYDSDGNEIWNNRFNFSDYGEDYGYKVLLDSENNVFVGGTVYADSGSVGKILKYSSDGDQLLTFDVIPNYTLRFIDHDDNLIFSGSQFSVKKYTNNGNEIWSFVYENEEYSDLYRSDIEIDFDDNIYLTGSWIDRSEQRTGINGTTMKLLPNGELDWEIVQNRRDEENTAIELSDSGDVFVAGHEGVSDGHSRRDWYWFLPRIIKYVQFPETEITANILSSPLDEYALETGYPNPFNSSINIQFRLKNPVEVRIAVSNLSGREVDVLIHGNMSAGEYEIPWEADFLSSGVYFVTMNAGNFHATKKIVLMK